MNEPLSWRTICINLLEAFMGEDKALLRTSMKSIVDRLRAEEQPSAPLIMAAPTTVDMPTQEIPARRSQKGVPKNYTEEEKTFRNQRIREGIARKKEQEQQSHTAYLERREAMEESVRELLANNDFPTPLVVSELAKEYDLPLAAVETTVATELHRRRPEPVGA